MRLKFVQPFVDGVSVEGYMVGQEYDFVDSARANRLVMNGIAVPVPVEAAPAAAPPVEAASPPLGALDAPPRTSRCPLGCVLIPFGAGNVAAVRRSGLDGLMLRT